VEKDGAQTRTLEARVRLGTALGVAQFGQIGFLYLEGYGEVQFEDVLIEKAGGRRVEVTNGIVEDINPLGVSGTSLPADIRFRKLTIPGLEPGDVLSYRIVHRQKPLSSGRIFGEFKLLAAGGLRQTYELDLPRVDAIRVRLRDGLGATREEVPSAADRVVRRLSVEVKPPIAGQALTRAEREAWTEPDVMFSSFGSWPEVAGWWWRLSRDRLKPDAAVAEQASELTAGAGTERERIEALHAFVATRIRYVNVSFGLGRMQPRPAADVLQNRYGDCKDKHALLAALATSLGLDVRPVLVSTELADLRDDVPGPQQFDHMISVIRRGESPSEWIWLDGTNPFGGPRYLVPALRDKRALLIEADGGGLLVRTPEEAPFVPRLETVVKGSLDAGGRFRGRVTWRLRSDEELAVRALFAALPPERRAAAVKETLARDWGDVTVENVLLSPLEDVASPLRVEFDADKQMPAEGGERRVGVPLPDFGLPDPLDPVPDGEPPVTFSLREVSLRAEIEVAESHRARAPLSVSIARPFGSFRSVYSVEGRMLKLERTLALSRSTLSTAELLGYQSFRKAITADHRQEFGVEGGAAAASAPTAEDLREEGLAAFEKQDYVRAVERLQKAAEADPKLQDVFEDLGRALTRLGSEEEAVAALTRQVEITPFHESAYAWRAYVLDRLGRDEEAERDLLKQIEVAPFKPWSYERLAERRANEEKLAEAADLYARAASIEPKEPERWLDLGLVQVRAGKQSEARQSIDRATSLDPEAWMRVLAADAYRTLGDLSRAGELAESALPSIRRRLARLTPDSFGEGDIYWTERLIDSWTLLGQAADAAGDAARAERYLEAAWRVGFSPRAGWTLGERCLTQGRLPEAVELLSMAAFVPSAGLHLPADRQARIDSLRGRLPAPEPGLMPVPGETQLTELRMLRPTGPAVAALNEEVLLLVGADCRVEHIAPRSPTSGAAIETQVAKLGPIRLSWPRPDGEPLRVVLSALLACSTASGCVLIRDLPGMKRVSEDDPGSIRIVSVDPNDGAKVAPGAQVTVKATVHYELKGPSGRIALVVQDQAGKSVGTVRSRVVTQRAGELALEVTFSVPGDATRLDVFVPLTSREGAATRTVATAHYVVGPGRRP
jgi:tetratricopeptide (TPR) repeat protein